MTEGEAEAVRDGQSAGTQRVVLRGVDVLVLDDLPRDTATEVATVVGAAMPNYVMEAWVPMASRPGAMEAAVKSYAGQSGAPDARPGKYKAVPHGSWFVPPMVIEPPLP